MLHELSFAGHDLVLPTGAVRERRPNGHELRRSSLRNLHRQQPDLVVGLELRPSLLLLDSDPQWIDPVRPRLFSKRLQEGLLDVGDLRRLRREEDFRGLEGFPHVLHDGLREPAFVRRITRIDVALVPHPVAPVGGGDFSVALGEQHLGVEVRPQDVRPPGEPGPHGSPDVRGHVLRNDERSVGDRCTPTAVFEPRRGPDDRAVGAQLLARRESRLEVRLEVVAPIRGKEGEVPVARLAEFRPDHDDGRDFRERHLLSNDADLREVSESESVRPAVVPEDLRTQAGKGEERDDDPAARRGTAEDRPQLVLARHPLLVQRRRGAGIADLELPDEADLVEVEVGLHRLHVVQDVAGRLVLLLERPDEIGELILDRLPVFLRPLDEFPGKTFAGTIARNSNSIDPASRTLLVEVDVDNRSGTLFPGAYVRVRLKLPQTVSSVTIPANTLLFRSEGLRVGVVRNGRAELVPVTIGRDYGSSVEVVSGLQPTDRVILNPSDSLISGTTVQVNAPPAQAAAR